MMFTIMKGVPPEEQIKILKATVAMGIAANYFNVALHYATYRRLKKLAEAYRRLEQVTDILVKHADMSNPALQADLQVYQDFLAIFNESGMGPEEMP